MGVCLHHVEMILRDRFFFMNFAFNYKCSEEDEQEKNLPVINFPVHSGVARLSVTVGPRWGIFVSTSPMQIVSTRYESISFWTLHTFICKVHGCA